jgi:hypothetical protein
MHTGKLVFAQLMEHLPLTTFSSLCGALRWRSQGQAVHLFGSIPVDGLCAIDLSRESQRRVLARSPPRSITWAFAAARWRTILGQRQRNSGLAHLLRIRTASDRDVAKALCQRAFWSRSERYCLRFRCDHYRSVPVGVPVGLVSFDQRGYQAAYALGLEAVSLLSFISGTASGTKSTCSTS